ncbi:osmosensitive K+ channel signal transduction histidine kinase [Pedosphaera parvula Ellin514]|uniref:histidine kinase n=2 Tax=Pedosphaera TaxID=1032526 RepID=B9XJD4_PEDPL|nr:osmosensitive K+ channel signal transduction histidine kinase [Pedosphaera parvula Ellin514]
MAPGVGKTYAMLQSARKEKDAGRDVVIGWVETHDSKETAELMQDLPLLAPRYATSDGVSVAQLDLETLLARRPQLALVDDLAHANVVDARHRKRYQDVLELLDAGIDVFTTLSVQHVASRADTVQQITGATVRDMVPDSVLDSAEIELIDISPGKLLERLSETTLRLSDYSQLAQSDFFRPGNLMALREMTLRLVAERVGQGVHDYMKTMQIQGPWKSGHRLLVAVGPNALAEQLIRWTRRLADSLNSPWIALYVEVPRPLNQEVQSRVTRNLSLARDLGAEVITTTDADVVKGLLRVAMQHNVTQVIVGEPLDVHGRKFSHSESIVRRLISESGEIDIHVVRADHGTPGKLSRQWKRLDRAPWKQYLAAIGAVLAVTLAAFLFTPLIGVHSTALIFLLTVVVLALFVQRGPSLLAAAMSAILWDYFFLPPVFAFRVSHIEDGMLLGMYFVVALVLGQLTARIRAQEEAERQREERATALYLLTRELAEGNNLDQMLQKMVRQMESVFKAQIAVLLQDPPNRLSRQAHSASAFQLSEPEHRVACWAFEHAQPAGAFTDNLPVADALYVPLTTATGTVGVMGLRFSQSFPPTMHQRTLLNTFSQQIALALDRLRLQQVSEKSKILAESERLTKTLLNSISHEIRTPIAAIQSAASNLVELNDAPLSEPQQSMVGEIQEATDRLNRLVGNVLEITRIESGHVKPRLSLCDVNDLVHVCIKETRKQLARHGVTVDLQPHLPLVPMDFVLIQQALSNLLSNAALHTRAGTSVRLTARVEQTEFVLSVADQGAGIPAEALPRIFDKFYRAPNAPAGGTGLGLSLVKGFVEAHGGSVLAQNDPKGGAIFAIRLPINQSPSNQPAL